MSFKYLNQFLKYSFVGIICQLLDYVLTMILFAKDIDLFVANSIGYLVGSFTSYIGHTKFTFRKTSRKLLTNQQIIFFIFACFLGSLSGYIIIKLFMIFKINIAIAKFYQLFIIALVQYILNTRFTFNRKKF